MGGHFQTDKLLARLGHAAAVMGCRFQTDKLLARLGHFLFRSQAVTSLYFGLVLSRRRWAHSVGLSLLAVLYLCRTARLFLSPSLKAAALLALVAAQAAALAAPLPVAATGFAAVVLLLASALVLLAGRHGDDGIGHRAGTLGYNGPHFENTVEAAAALLEKDRREGPLPDFPYLEFDVQETADGELVIFHDSLLSRAFPTGGANAGAVEQLQQETGTAFGLLTVQDLSLAQLQSLHLGGRPGVRVPTLQQFLEAAAAAGVRRTLAVEVKRLRSDPARQRFLDTLSCYRAAQTARLDADPAAVRRRCGALGWVGVIAFPHLFAASFGEYGSPEWHRWAAEFKRRGIPARACHALWLSLTG